jgi:general secretion pathway protein M
MTPLIDKLNELVSKLRAWYAGLQERERRVVGIGAVTLGAMILVGGILLPLHSAVSAAVKRAENRREDLAWIRANAAEIQSGASAMFNTTGEAPVVVVDRVGREQGLGPGLKGSQPSGNGVRVQLEGVPFDVLVAWMAMLDQRYGLSIDSITIDRAARPGLVNANVTFVATQR